MPTGDGFFFSQAPSPHGVFYIEMGDNQRYLLRAKNSNKMIGIDREKEQVVVT